MNRLAAIYSSNLGKKIIAAVTGLILFGFIAGHIAGNLKVFTGTTAEGLPHIDEYAHFLRVIGCSAGPRKHGHLDRSDCFADQRHPAHCGCDSTGDAKRRSPPRRLRQNKTQNGIRRRVVHDVFRRSDRVLHCLPPAAFHGRCDSNRRF